MEVDMVVGMATEVDMGIDDRLWSPGHGQKHRADASPPQCRDCAFLIRTISGTLDDSI